MAVTYMFEKCEVELDGQVNVEVLVHDTNTPREQTLLRLEFPSGTSVSQINQKVGDMASLVASLTRPS